MIAFLTSSPGGSCLAGGVRTPCRLSEENGFLDRLSAVWPEQAHCLLICAEPDNTTENDEMRQNFLQSLPMSGLSLFQLKLCDGRNEDALPTLLAQSNVVILSGGHTLTQNHFFKKIGLKPLIRGFDGVLIGISGGSMNSAEVVYAQPEWEGDFDDPSYERFPEGLGLTDIMILPHYQLLKDQVLEGRRLIEDVALPDSVGRTFYALPDGSYVYIQDGKSQILGEAYEIHDGCITRL